MDPTELAAGRTEHGVLYGQLQRKEAELRLLFDANIVGIVFWDLDGAVRDANDAFLRMVGYERADLVSGRLRWTDLTPPEWLQRDREIAEAQVRLIGRVPPYEKEFFRKDGSRVPVLIGGAAFDEEIKRGVAFVVDITARKRAELALRRSEQYLAEAQRLSHSGVAAYNETTILYGSEEIYRIWGFDPAQGVPSREAVFRQIHPDDRGRLLAEVQRAVGEKRGYSTGYRIVLPDGTTKHLEVIGQPVFSASGELVEIVTTQIDVTEQKRASQERRAHLWFLESMDRINRAMQRSNDVELMTSGVMQEALEIFACDRACLTYPCDPDAPTYRTVMEHTSPEYGGVLTLGQDLPVTPEWAKVLRQALHHPGAVVDPSLPPGRHERFGIASMLAIAVRPKGDQPYLFVVHSARSRPWTATERRLFEETARRLGDALTSVLAHRNLLASEKELRRSQHYLAEGQKISHTGSWAWNPVTNEVPYWSEESYRIYGFDPAQGIPPFESTWERVHPEDRDALRKAIESSVREKAALQAEHRLVLPGGIVRNHRVLAHPVLNASGELIEYLGTVVDVTEQKRAEEERKEHLWFFESMDRINRAMQRTNDVEGMMSGVLEEMLAIFGSDRARLVYPCDPDAATCRVVMEHSRPEYPGVFALGQELPMDRHSVEFVRRVLDSPGALDLSFPPEMRERFRMQSAIAIAVRPRGDRPYLLGLHQCSRARTWTAAERRLFEEIARRLEDALTSLLAHRKLLQREAEVRRLVDADIVGIVFWDLDGGIRDANDAFLRVAGYERADLVSGRLRWTDLTPAEWRERDDRAVAELNSTGTFQPFEKEYFRKDGSRVPVLIGGALFQEGGKEGVAFVLDLSEQRRAEEALRSSEAYLAEAQTLSQTGSWAWSPDQDIRYWSEECYRVLSFDPHDGLPRFEQFFQRIHPDDQPGFRELTQTATREKAEWKADYRIVHPGGAVRDVHVVGHPVLSTSGHLVEFVGTVIDVTESKRAEQELRTSELERARAEQALRNAREKLAQASKIASLAELSASIAHEINQPLQAIVANGHASLRWLDATPPNIEKAIRTAERVVRDGNAAAEVVSRIRALFNHAAPAKVDLDMNKLIEQVRTLMADEIQGNGVSLETSLGEDLPRIRADAVQIQQVIVNLVRNAIEAMAGAPRKPLLIRSRRSASHVTVEVRDQGTGLVDPEKIFEPFVSTKETGMGMGLTICRSIVEAHAGDIRVVHNEGPGVTFSFSLPSEASDAT